MTKTNPRKSAVRKAYPRPGIMTLTLTRSDLDAMPARLRRQLLLYLDGRPRSQGRQPRSRQATEGTVAASPLGRREVAALLRDVSFHRLGKPLRALLDRLAYDDAGSPPTRRMLASALPAGERDRLGRYVAMLNRLAAKMVKQSGSPVCCFTRGTDSYTLHPTTRRWMRDLLPGIEHAGNQQEPLWE